MHLGESMMGFSLWSHLSGCLTFYIYNSCLLYLELVGSSDADQALYTVVGKVSNLFFVLPMFFQVFVPVVLANASSGSDDKLKKLAIANATISIGQFLFFVFFGDWLGAFFGLDEEGQYREFYMLGLITNSGILILNLIRPYISFLMVRSFPHRVVLYAFGPAALLATILYPLGVWAGGPMGGAVSYAFTNVFLAISFAVLYIAHRSHIKSSTEGFGQ
jgi:hypothetical protein